MTEKRFFADVDLPFHVWVREGCRWVLRDAAAGLQGEALVRRAIAFAPQREERAASTLL